MTRVVVKIVLQGIFLHCLGVATLSQGNKSPVLLFLAEHEGTWQLFAWNWHDAPSRLTTSSTDARSSSASPDGSRIAFSTSDGALWLLNVKAHETRKLGARFSTGSYGFPTWIDNNVLAYTLYSVTPPAEDSDIYAYSFLEGKQHAIIRQTGSQDYGSASPDGTRLAYMSSVTTTVVGLGASITQQLWIANLLTGKVEQLTVGGSHDTKSTWSPDGRRIAFTSDRDGNLEIWVVDIETRILTKLTNGRGEKTDPCWSPDGKNILYVTTATGKRRLELMDVDSGQTTSVRPFGRRDVEIRDPTWGR